MAYDPAKYERIREQFPLDAFYEQHCGELDPQGGWLFGLCPFHEERTPSFGIKGNAYWCFAEGRGGDVLDLARHLGIDLDAVPGRPLGRRKVQPLVDHSKFKLNPLPVEIIAGTRERLLNPKTSSERRAKDYLARKRGLEHTDIELYKLGFMDSEERGERITIPVTGWKHCQADEDPESVLNYLDLLAYSPAAQVKMLPAFSGQASWLPFIPFPNRMYPDCELWLCEGEWDALLLTKMGKIAVTNTHGVASAPSVWSTVAWRHLINAAGLILIAFDNDEAGDRATKKVVESLIGLEDRIWRVDWPKQCAKGYDICAHLIDHKRTIRQLEGRMVPVL